MSTLFKNLTPKTVTPPKAKSRNFFTIKICEKLNTKHFLLQIVSILKFFAGKLGQFDFAKSCFGFPLPLVNIYI